jgi:hypothetical protein
LFRIILFCSIELSNDVKFNNKMMETTDKQAVRTFPKHIRIHLPEQDDLTKVWAVLKAEARNDVKRLWNDVPWPEGAVTRSTLIKDLEYFVCYLDGGRHETGGFHEQFFSDHTTPDREMVGDIAIQAMDVPVCARDGFRIDVECRVDLEYRDADGDIVLTDEGMEYDLTDIFVCMTAFTHNPVKCTDENLRLFQAYQHFLFYIDLNHIEENNPWKDTPGMCKHFLEKLQLLYRRESSAGSPNLIDCDSIVKWVQDMTPHNQQKLFDYILVHHIDRY